VRTRIDVHQHPAFAEPDHVLFGSDWPFAPAPAGRYFAAGLDEHLSHTPFGATIAAAINHDSAAALFPRLAHRAAPSRPTDRRTAARAAIKNLAARAAVTLVDPTRT
jgi:hypothetical protein